MLNEGILIMDNKIFKNEEVNLISPNGKQYVEIRRGEIDEGVALDPRESKPNNAIMYIVYKDEVLGDAWENQHLDKHSDRLNEIDNFAEVRLPLYLEYHPYGKSVLKTDKFEGGDLVGVVYTTRESLATMGNEDWSLEEQREAIRNEVQEYQDFLSGNAWGWLLYDVVSYKNENENEDIDLSDDKHINLVESCLGGYLGDTAVRSIIEELGLYDWRVKGQEQVFEGSVDLSR